MLCNTEKAVIETLRYRCGSGDTDKTAAGIFETAFILEQWRGIGFYLPVWPECRGWGNIMGIPIESVSIFWFILALFGGWNLYNGIVQLKSVRLQHFLSAGCVVLGYLLTKLSKIWPFCLPMVLIAVGYLASGEWIRKNHLLRKRIPLLCWIIMAAVVLFSAAFGQINMVACIWHLGLVDVASTFGVGFLVLWG